MLKFLAKVGLAAAAGFGGFVVYKHFHLNAAKRRKDLNQPILPGDKKLLADAGAKATAAEAKRTADLATANPNDAAAVKQAYDAHVAAEAASTYAAMVKAETEKGTFLAKAKAYADTVWGGIV